MISQAVVEKCYVSVVEWVYTLRKRTGELLIRPVWSSSYRVQILIGDRGCGANESYLMQKCSAKTLCAARRWTLLSPYSPFAKW